MQVLDLTPSQGARAAAALQSAKAPWADGDPFDHITRCLVEMGSRYEHKRWQCPAHPDRDPSLSVSRGRTGNALVKCHAGCSTESVMRAMGLGMRHLFPAEARRSKEPPKAYWKALATDYAAGTVMPEPIAFGPLPPEPTTNVAVMADTVRRIIGLYFSTGDRRPVPISYRFAAREAGWGDKQYRRAGYALSCLVRCGFMQHVGHLDPRGGQSEGTFIYAPPEWSADVGEVPTGEIEAAALQPVAELVDEARVSGAQAVCGDQVRLVAARDGARSDGGLVAGAKRDVHVSIHRWKRIRPGVNQDGEVMPF